jgi:hypothetical protein
MAFADSSVYKDVGDGSIIGSFQEKEAGNLFEFSHNQDLSEVWAYRFPHKIWVTTPREGIDQGYRYGIVKKTVAYLAVDEDEYGEPVLEKWQIKNLREYAI